MKTAVLIPGADPRSVIDVIEADEDFELSGFDLVRSEEARRGWVHNGGLFSPPALSLSDRKAALHAAVHAKRDTILAGGFTHDFGAHGVRVLQTRNVDDKIAWLTSQASYSTAVAAGAGAVMGASFRPEDDETFTVSFQDGRDALLAMAAWGAAVYANSWSLKDAIAAASDEAALDAIDIEAGWPA